DLSGKAQISKKPFGELASPVCASWGPENAALQRFGFKGSEPTAGENIVFPYRWPPRRVGHPFGRGNVMKKLHFFQHQVPGSMPPLHPAARPRYVPSPPLARRQRLTPPAEWNHLRDRRPIQLRLHSARQFDESNRRVPPAVAKASDWRSE